MKQSEPYANEKDLIPFLSCIDHTVSRETFQLLMDTSTNLLVTSPRPSLDKLSAYYESEDYISHTDSKRSIMDKAYQVIKNYSVKKKVKMINGLSGSKGRILDIGCGTGDLLSACEKNGWKINGVEPSDKARALAAKKISSKEFLVSNIDEVSNDSKERYDVITMFHVLEHVPNLLEYVAKLKGLLTDDGSLIIAVPNYKSYDASYYKEFWAAYDVPRHLWHFSQDSIRFIFERNNFRVEKVLPLIFDSFYVSLLSEKYKTGKSNLFSGFKTGLRSNMKAKKTGEYSSLIYVIKNNK